MMKRFKISAIIIFILIGTLFLYRYSPYKIEFLGHYDKIWAHRVNSLEKLHKSIKYFKGIELDLVYDETEHYLDVNHPPAESIQLSFSTYLDKVGDKRPYLWLDIKNLNIENSPVIFKHLQQILQAKTYPFERVLIESQTPETLDIFTEAGFMTSYYIPYGLGKMKENEFQKEIEKVSLLLEKQPKIGISSSYRDYEIMNEYFPNRKKYVWIVESFRQKNYRLIKTVLNDENVKVVLIAHRTTIENR